MIQTIKEILNNLQQMEDHQVLLVHLDLMQVDQIQVDLKILIKLKLKIHFVKIAQMDSVGNVIEDIM